MSINFYHLKCAVKSQVWQLAKLWALMISTIKLIMMKKRVKARKNVAIDSLILSLKRLLLSEKSAKGPIQEKNQPNMRNLNPIANNEISLSLYYKVISWINEYLNNNEFFNN